MVCGRLVELRVCLSEGFRMINSTDFHVPKFCCCWLRASVLPLTNFDLVSLFLPASSAPGKLQLVSWLAVRCCVFFPTASLAMHLNAPV